MSFEITPMSNRVLPIALGAAVAVVSLGAIAIPAANAQPMVVVRPARHHHHHRGGWNVPPAAAAMAGAGILMNGIAHMEQAHQPVVYQQPIYQQPVVYQQPVYAQPMPVMAPAGW